MKSTVHLFFVAFVFILVTSATGAVIQVPGQYTVISKALGAAQAGDTVLVAPGVYKEMITWPRVDGIKLIAVGGAAVTTIDANGQGRVINFGSGLTRATLLQGFTITGGLMKTTRNHGCGIYVGSSPTLRFNHIKANVGDGPNWNYGGGIYITSSARPLIERNRIEGNTLKNGSWNYGAGIYVGSGSNPEILGNTIIGNVNDKGSRGYGGGIFVGATGVKIVGNIIANNICRSGSWNYGAGIRVYSSSSAEIIANTIAYNQVIGGSWQYGGGIEYSGTGGKILNNVIVNNSAKQGGGIKGATAAIIDYNDVWQNTGGNYSGCTAGKNDISVDPLFRQSGDYHLKPTSPCIDKALNAHVAKLATFDFDGDPRLQDGNLDGLAGNGAQADMGADEFNHVSLSLATTGQMGKLILFDLKGMAGGAGILMLSPLKGNAFIDPYGVFLLGNPWLILGRYTPPAKVPLVIAPHPLLVGLPIYLQGITVSWQSQPVGNTTNRLEMVLY